MATASVMTNNLIAQKKVQGSIGTAIAGVNTPDATSLRHLKTNVVDGQLIGVKATDLQAHFEEGLSNNLRDDLSINQFHQSIQSVLSRLQILFGSTEQGGVFNETLSTLENAFSTFAVRPDEDISKKYVITSAENFVSTIKDFEEKLQEMRQETDQNILASVQKINQNIKWLEQTNHDIISAEFSNQTTAAATNKQYEVLQNIAEEIDINVARGQQGQLDVYTKSMIPLYTSLAHELSFTPHASIHAASTYPDSLGGLYDASGQDVTHKLQAGHLKGLFDLRDKILPRLSQDINAFTTTIKDHFNKIHNKGTGLPPPSELNGQLTIQGNDTLHQAGQFHIGVVSQDGKIIAKQTFDLDVIGNTPNDIIAAINANMGGQAQANLVNNKVVLRANNGHTISIHEDTSQLTQSAFTLKARQANGNIIENNYDIQALGGLAPLAAQINNDYPQIARAEIINNQLRITQQNNSQLHLNDGPLLQSVHLQPKGISHFFELNNFFTASSTPLSPHMSSSIDIRADLKENANFLSHGYLDLTAAIGQTALTKFGIPNQDHLTTAQEMSDLFYKPAFFNMTHNLSGGDMKIGAYLADIVGYTSQLTESTQQNLSISDKKIHDLHNKIQDITKLSLEELFTMLMITSQAMGATSSAIQQILKSDEMFTRIGI